LNLVFKIPKEIPYELTISSMVKMKYLRSAASSLLELLEVIGKNLPNMKMTFSVASVSPEKTNLFKKIAN